MILRGEMLVFIMIYNLQFSQTNSDFNMKQKLLESWDGFPGGDGSDDILFDLYSETGEDSHEDDELETDLDENIIILPFFSNEELSLRNYCQQLSMLQCQQLNQIIYSCIYLVSFTFISFKTSVYLISFIV